MQNQSQETLLNDDHFDISPFKKDPKDEPLYGKNKPVFITQINLKNAKIPV